MTWAIREKSYSHRHACALVGLHPKTYRYISKRSDDHAVRESSKNWRHNGDGLAIAVSVVVSQDCNLRWSLDFVSDTLVSGRRFRILTLVDDFTRECLGLVVDTSLTGLRVAREFDRIAELRGYPRMLVSDNGTELTSNAILCQSACKIGSDSHLMQFVERVALPREGNQGHASSSSLLPRAAGLCRGGHDLRGKSDHHHRSLHQGLWHLPILRSGLTTRSTADIGVGWPICRCQDEASSSW